MEKVGLIKMTNISCSLPYQSLSKQPNCSKFKPYLIQLKLNLTLPISKTKKETKIRIDTEFAS